MKYYELTPEEKQILGDFEKGEFKPVKNSPKLKAYFKKVAKNTFNKTRNINLRLSERVLSRLKAKAAEAGIPYQTLAASILHRFVAS